MVRQLIADERVGLSGFPRADAFVALYPYINKVVVPRGVGNLTKDQPPNDVTLIATKASLVVRDDLHPALQYLRSIRDRAFSIVRTNFPPPRRSTCR